MTEFQQVLSPSDAGTVSGLAREIWQECYAGIVSARQVEYMLTTFQSAEAILRQVAAGCRYYIVHDRADGIGYVALRLDEDPATAFLSKIYFRAIGRGRGHGAATLAFGENLWREAHRTRRWRTVNRHNVRAIAWYERRGFVNEGPILQDIGSGFVMDDFKYAKMMCGGDGE